MPSLLTVILSSFCLFTIVSGLRCYVEQGFLNSTNTNSGNTTECYGLAYTCTKSVNYNLGTYLKTCGTSNCTTPGTETITNQATCHNTTKTPNYAGEVVPQTAVCCCYGDGCNSAPPSQILGSGLFAIGTIFFAKILI